MSIPKATELRLLTCYSNLPRVGWHEAKVYSVAGRRLTYEAQFKGSPGFVAKHLEELPSKVMEKRQQALKGERNQ